MTDTSLHFPSGSLADMIDTILRMRENEKKIEENNKKIEQFVSMLRSQVGDKKASEIISEQNKQLEEAGIVAELFPRNVGLKKIEKNLSVFNNLLFDMSLHLTRQEH